MLKIFNTQLNGLFKGISEQEFPIEDAARLLAQAAIGDGNIYIHGFKEMQGILPQALEGLEAIPNGKPLFQDKQQMALSPVDRVLIASRYSHDSEAVSLAKQLQEEQIPFIALSTITDEQQEGIHDLADIHINLNVKRGLIPTETGERIGYPSLLVALYAIYAITLTLIDVMEELQE
ncbi:MAG: DUF2529 family protein [Bacillus sp. (in: firmicutes)]